MQAKYCSWRNAIDEIKEEVRRMKKKRRARKALHKRFSTFANLMKQSGVDSTRMLQEVVDNLEDCKIWRRGTKLKDEYGKSRARIRLESASLRAPLQHRGRVQKVIIPGTAKIEASTLKQPYFVKIQLNRR